MPTKPILYLDWNILNKLWSDFSLNEDTKHCISQLEELIESQTFFIPYSNAHMRDLSRGVVKHPQYKKGHLDTIERATGNLCLTQYWGEPHARWHYRDAGEFLENTLNDNDFGPKSFSDLFSDPELDSPGILSWLHNLRLSLMEGEELPVTFKECYKADPIFSVMFPKSKIDNNMRSLVEDIYEFSRVIMSDHVLYRQFRKFLNNAKVRSVEVRKIDNQINKQTKAKPTHLDWDNLWDEVNINNEYSKNAKYNLIVDLYTRTDLKGYKPDERFSNMIDDALHSFYGAHCNYFVTMDERCLLKARKVYSDLKIESKVVFLPEFLSLLKLDA